MDAFLLPLLLVAVVAMLGYQMYRQSKRVKEQREAVSALAPGTRVMLSNGFIGTLVSVGDTTLDVELAPGVVTTVVKQAYGQTLPAETEPTDGPTDVEDGDADERALLDEPADTEPPTHRVVRDESGPGAVDEVTDRTVVDDVPPRTGDEVTGPSTGDTGPVRDPRRTDS